jgi:asparagine synthase (glutamine-hydrolysing)
MCGIAGIIGRLDDRNRAALGRMSAAIAHRGPDDEGMWVSSPDEQGHGALLAFRRLAILDLTPAGAQPMVDPVTGHVIVYNGEIYNYRELKERLVAQGQRFESSGDTAVMLRALALNGAHAVRWLRGMFAFALWDPAERKLLLARDPLGIKPLYFARNPNPQGDWSLLFASELRAILASGLLGTARLNPLAAASMAWNGFMVTPQTAIAGVDNVWPGELCVFDAAGREERRESYWTVPEKHAAGAIGEAELGEVLQEGVRAHLASDVPLAVFLSGGVDSSAVANLAQSASAAPVHTFTLAFEEPEYNEGPVARRISEAIGTRHQEVVLSEARFVAQLEAALDSLDQPTFDALNSYYMAQAVRDAGFTVALVGTGGDELFGGYTSFRDLPALLRWSARARWLPGALRMAFARAVAAAMQPARGSIGGQARWAKLPEMLRRQDDLLALYQLAYALFLPDFQRQLLGGALADAVNDGLPAAMRSRLLRETASRSPLAAISVMEQRLFLGERLLRDTDVASMAASLEVRLPLVDQVFVEAVSRLSDNERYLPLRKKSILRRIGLRGLDPTLFDRPKAGFVLPLNRWLRASLGKVMDQVMRDPAAVAPTGLDPNAVRRLWQAFVDGAPLYWSRVWAIYVFIRWCHRHRVYA